MIITVFLCFADVTTYIMYINVY